MLKLTTKSIGNANPVPQTMLTRHRLPPLTGRERRCRSDDTLSVDRPSIRSSISMNWLIGYSAKSFQLKLFPKFRNLQIVETVAKRLFALVSPSKRLPEFSSRPLAINRWFNQLGYKPLVNQVVNQLVYSVCSPVRLTSLATT